MSSRADTPPRPPLVLLRVLLVASLVMGLVTVITPPAEALHQHCGDDLVTSGSNSNGPIDTGSLSNGHPNLDRSANIQGWGGIGQIQALEKAVRGLEFTQVILGDVYDVLLAVAEVIHAGRVVTIKAGLTLPPPGGQIVFSADQAVSTAEKVLRYIAVAFKIAETIVFIAETVVSAVLFVTQRAVDDEDGCGGTLVADTTSMTWVSIVQRNLASTGPPLAILMAPHAPDLATDQREWPLLPQSLKSDFGWCPDIPDAYRGQLPAATVPPAAPSTALLPETGGDCASTVHIGFLDAPTLGVKDIVTSSINHMTAHGLDVRDAREILVQADLALTSGQYSNAYHLYRDAYQAALRVTS